MQYSQQLAFPYPLKILLCRLAFGALEAAWLLLAAHYCM
jgi:hypothetical protein